MRRMKFRGGAWHTSGRLARVSPLKPRRSQATPGLSGETYGLILLIFEPSSDKSPIRPFSAKTKPRIGLFCILAS